jgi:hypothetical protein
MVHYEQTLLALLHESLFQGAGNACAHEKDSGIKDESAEGTQSLSDYPGAARAGA